MYLLYNYSLLIYVINLLELLFELFFNHDNLNKALKNVLFPDHLLFKFSSTNIV